VVIVQKNNLTKFGYLFEKKNCGKFSQLGKIFSEKLCFLGIFAIFQNKDN
jgi:hypothetical protein